MLLACLLATTAFVFANSKKFANEGLYVYDGSTHHQISANLLPGSFAVSLPGTTGSTTIEIKDNPSGTARMLHYFDGTNYVDVRSDGTW